jgi:hypothetical protein
MEMQIILMGIGYENHYMTTLDGKPVEGFALRLFDPNTRLWSIYWADSQNGILDNPVVGSFDGNKGYFFANDHFSGKEILLQFEWDITNPSQPVWKQAFSVDKGNIWEWNWYMYFTKTESIEDDADDIIYPDDHSATFPAERTFDDPKPKSLSLSFKRLVNLKFNHHPPLRNTTMI